jgi:glucose/arabinose dehydrogenase/PKD repeat protein
MMDFERPVDVDSLSRGHRRRSALALHVLIAVTCLFVQSTLASAFQHLPTDLDAVKLIGQVRLLVHQSAVSGRLDGLQATLFDGAGDSVVIDLESAGVDRADIVGRRVEANGRWRGDIVQLVDGSGPARVLRVTSIQILPEPDLARRHDLGPLNATVPQGFNLETVAGGLDQPVAFAFAPDGRVFIGLKSGRVHVVQDGVLLPTLFVSISNSVNNTWDRGMLGLAVHPEFPAQPYVYLLFTYDPPEVYGGTGAAGPDGQGARVSRLIRITADEARGYNIAVPGSEVVLLGTNSTFANIGDPTVHAGSPPSCGAGPYVRDCVPADEASHTIGAVRFGLDGTLFVSNGDGADFEYVQPYGLRTLDPNSLSGKLLRIDPLTGAGLADNPFFDGDPGSNRSKVYSLGLRNPFRFTVHPITGEPHIGDVGWTSWEEINVGRGANFGWPCYEGGGATSLAQWGYSLIPECATWMANPGSVIAPSYSYSHTQGLSAMVMGDFYTGQQYPEVYRDALFFIDFNAGFMQALTTTAEGRIHASDFVTGLPSVTQLSQGPDHMFYMVDIDNGVLRRLRFTDPLNTAPRVAARLESMSLDTLTAQFSSDGSSDPDGDALAFRWSFGDGQFSAEPNPSHVYVAPGVYQVALTVSDPFGASDSASFALNAGQYSPVATIDWPEEGARFSIGDTIHFGGTATDVEDGTLPGNRLSWSLRLRHNEHIHYDGIPPTTGTAGNFVVEDHGDNTWLELCLAATDSSDASDRRCVALYPNTVVITVTSQPMGLPLARGGVTRTTPFTATVAVGSHQQLSAPAVFNDLRFDNWSDGGTREHAITVGAWPQTITATYRLNGAPVITPPGRQTSQVGSAVMLRIVAADPDGDPITFAASGLPHGLSIDPVTGQIGGVVGAVSSGAYEVTVMVTDGQLQSISTFEWEVLAPQPTPSPGTVPAEIFLPIVHDERVP